MRDRRQENQEQNGTEHIWTLDEMVQRMGEHVNRILRENLYELRLNERQLCRLERQKKELRENLMRCGIGDALAKSYVLEFMQESLLKLFHLNEQTMDRVHRMRSQMSRSCKSTDSVAGRCHLWRKPSCSHGRSIVLIRDLALSMSCVICISMVCQAACRVRRETIAVYGYSIRGAVYTSHFWISGQRQNWNGSAAISAVMSSRVSCHVREGIWCMRWLIIPVW